MSLRACSNGEELLLDWQANTTTACDWSGVTCDNAGRATVLDLSGLGLRGTLPPQGWALPLSLQLLMASVRVHVAWECCAWGQ